MLRMCAPIADYITTQPSAPAWTIVLGLMPFLSINTRIVIADEFRDKPTVRALEAEMAAARQAFI
jgi:hypothetical protein